MCWPIFNNSDVGNDFAGTIIFQVISFGDKISDDEVMTICLLTRT
jgi:hypothetical protein